MTGEEEDTARWRNGAEGWRARGQPAPSMCRALYDFDSPADDEISLETGEVIRPSAMTAGGGEARRSTQGGFVLAQLCGVIELSTSRRGSLERRGGEPRAGVAM